ncbi:hypothetical protein VTO73DRAFT_6810 [Trametes versicolor]
MVQTKRITLYASVDSPFPHRVRLALEEAKAKYDIIWIDLIAKPEWFEKKVNKAGGKVPTLIYGGGELHEDEEPSPDAATLVESLVILEFLADTFPEAHLLPADPLLRARARTFYMFIETKLIAAFLGFIFATVSADDMLALLETIQGMLPPTGYAVGEWSIADAAFSPILLRWVHSLENGLAMFTPETVKQSRDAFNSPRFDRLRKYLEDNVARPSMSKTYDREALEKTMVRRLERFRKTGVITSELKMPLL